MLRYGVNNKILSLISSIYNKAKSYVKKGNKISIFLSCNKGVRQGEKLTPILLFYSQFTLYLNDFNETISNNLKGYQI